VNLKREFAESAEPSRQILAWDFYSGIEAILKDISLMELNIMKTNDTVNDLNKKITRSYVNLICFNDYDRR